MNGRPEFFDLYRWPYKGKARKIASIHDIPADAGVVMSRPLTESAFNIGTGGRFRQTWDRVERGVVTVYVLRREIDGRPIKAWALEAWDEPSLEVADQAIEDWGPWSIVSDTHDKEWRAFYLDMLVPLQRVLGGGLITASYSHSDLPLFAAPWSDPMLTARFEQLELAAKRYAEIKKAEPDVFSSSRLRELEDKLKKEYPVPGWSKAAPVGGGYTLPWATETSPRYTLLFEGPDSFDQWSVSDEAFTEEDWEWIVVDDNDVVVGVGTTPLEALKRVASWVWPDALAELGLMGQAEWLKTHVLRGEPIVDLSSYWILGLDSPAGWAHREFVAWAEGFDAS